MIQKPIKVPFVDLRWQHQPLSADLQQAITSVVERGDFVLGQAVTEFESSFAAACGMEWAVGVASGTDAIALGLKACGIGQGDEVLVPTNTFIASVIAVLQAGATPILVDCDPQTALIDLDLAVESLTPRTRAVLPVHLYGQMVSPKQLKDFADTHHLTIFEDAAQSHLASRESYYAGTIGQAAAFSFYPSKNLGAFGNGGIVVTNDEQIAKKVRSLRNYGAPRKYYHTELGTNSRLDTIQAAILQVKLPCLTEWNQQRNWAAQQYETGFQSLINSGLILPIRNDSGTGHVYHLYVIRLGKSFEEKREEIQQKLASKGIQTGIHYPVPCHLQSAYQFLGHRSGDFPQAEKLSAQILSLPMYPGLKSDQIDWVVEQCHDILN